MGITEVNKMANTKRNEVLAENFLVSERLKTPRNEREMIIPDLWDAMTSALFTGDGGTGKTHFTLQLLVALASGSEITGTPFKFPQPRPVVYVSQEDDGNFILQELLVQCPELESKQEVARRIRIISTAIEGKQLFLSEKDSLKYIIENLQEGCVLVLDSWSTFLTSDENSNSELSRKELQSLQNIIRERKASPLIIHHRPKRNTQTGMQGTSRGGTALPNRCRLHILIEGSHGAPKLRFEKVSRGVIPEPIDLIFDEERKLLLPKEQDRCVSVFQLSEELKTTEVMTRMQKDPTDVAERAKVLDMLRRRSRSKTLLQKVKDGVKGQDAVWKRVG
jgi:RecA-family ATPase